MALISMIDAGATVVRLQRRRSGAVRAATPDEPPHRRGTHPPRHPEARPHAPAAVPLGRRDDAQASATRRRPLISVVDDDESIREALESLLRSAGFDAEVFASAEQLLASDRLAEVACLIVDVRMPGGMTGLELQHHLAAAGSRVPVIFITAHDDEAARAQALRAGAAAFLRKPFSEQALLNAVQAAL
jgi:CheY-like chemotaxis protein